MSHRTLLVSGLIALVAACAAAWDLAGEPGLLLDVKRYYERHATEEYGMCNRPLLEGVTHSEVVSDDEEELVVRLRFFYRDAFMDDEDCERGARTGGPRCRALARCRGVTERTFTIARTPEGLEVVDMTGEARSRPRRDWSQPQPSRNAESPSRNTRSVR